MFENLKSKYQQLQDYTRDFNEYKNNEHIWDLEMFVQKNDESPKIYHNCMLKGWIAYLFCNLANTTFATTALGGSSATIAAMPTLAEIQEQDQSIGAGIIVGTSSTAVNVADFNMGTIINQGTSAGQLLYGPTSVAAFKVDADDEISWNISRSMHNRSGGTITVEEVGFIQEITLTVSQTGFLMDRSLSTNALLDGDRLTVTYHFKQT